MKDFSYTKSTVLMSQLNDIENLKRQLILTPLAPKTELKLQWQALLTHIHYTLALNGSSISQEHVLQLLSPQGKKNLSEVEGYVVRYKTALDYLYHNWLVNEKVVTAQDIVALYTITFAGILRITEEDLDHTLQYIQVNSEHPFIQAALAQYLMLSLAPFSHANEEFSHVVFLLFLYKNAYDLRRMVVLEEYLFEDMIRYKDLLHKLSKETDLTEWLEYMTHAVSMQLKKVLKTIPSEKQNVGSYKSLIELNDRQKKILGLLRQPGTKMTNKMVQKLYRVSQVTASRDLSKLTSLGLLLAVGGGRSTYYTLV